MATLPDYAVITEAIAGGRVSVQAIVHGDQDAHFIRPKPSFVDMVKRADMLVATGLDLELWLPTVVDRSGNVRVRSGRPGYVAASRAKGLPERWIFLRHVIRNSLIPTINLLGVNLGWLIGGTVVIETVFSVPGLGSLLVSSIFTRDYMVVMGITVAFACAIVIVNFIVDIATVALDPRIEL